MSKRLQILVTDQEYKTIRKQARMAHMTLGAWVRDVLRRAEDQLTRKSPRQKLQALETASKYSFPSGDIDQILVEIEEGYAKGLP